MKITPLIAALAMIALAGCVTNNVMVHDQSDGSVRYPDGRARKLLTMVPPEYPPALRKAGITGIVVVQLRIARDGSVVAARAVFSAHEELSALAVDAVKQWHFEPEPNDPKEFLIVQVPITFDLARNH
jgi:TonB family protein